MRDRWIVFGLVVGLLPGLGAAQDGLSLVREAAEKSTLDQAGTHPFHLRALLAPTAERDAESGRTGEIEIWWKAPGVYRRELRSAGFHQVEIVDGGKVWQKNEGDYLPDWLEEMARAILRPVPAESAAMKGIAPDKVMTMAGEIYLNWEKPLPMDMQPPKQSIDLWESSKLIAGVYGPGFGGGFQDYQDFHGRVVAQKVSHGSPEVTAKIVTLEDLPRVADGWFDATAPGGDAHPILLVVVEKTDLKNDVAGNSPPLVWPAIPNTRRSGVIWTDLAVDRAGKIREPFSTISDNPALNGFMHDYLAGLTFKPVLASGAPAQTIRHVVVHFDLPLPAGAADLGTAREAFERGRKASTLAMSATSPYQLKAKVVLALNTGKVEGTYVDSWQDAQHWRREARVGDGHVVRSHDGDKQYLLAEGSQANVAKLILTVAEPIPAGDTMTESDWRVDRDTLDDAAVTRVLSGRVEDGKAVDPKLATVYWFDGSGKLVQAYTSNLAITYAGYRAAVGSVAPTTILGRPSPQGGVALTVAIDEVGPLDVGSLGKKPFQVPGHEWKRQFTAEVR